MIYCINWTCFWRMVDFRTSHCKSSLCMHDEKIHAYGMWKLEPYCAYCGLAEQQRHVGGQDLSRCGHVLCWKSALALSGSQSVRGPGGMACRGWPAGCMLGDGARDSASFDPQHAGAPFCDVICIRSIIRPKTTEKLIHAFVTSRIDSCNALLFGIPEKDRSFKIANSSKLCCKTYWTCKEKRSSNAHVDTLALATCR